VYAESRQVWFGVAGTRLVRLVQQNLDRFGFGVAGSRLVRLVQQNPDRFGLV
jgi:hypothetical protein